MPEELHRGYRVCGVHFEDKMFLNDLRNRLQPHAVPTVFPNQPCSPCLIATTTVNEGNVCLRSCDGTKKITSCVGSLNIVGENSSTAFTNQAYTTSSLIQVEHNYSCGILSSTTATDENHSLEFHLD